MSKVNPIMEMFAVSVIKATLEELTALNIITLVESVELSTHLVQKILHDAPIETH